jgi:hypothetical protein
MTRKEIKAKEVGDWVKDINRIREEQQKKDNMLSPNRVQLNYLIDFIRSMQETAYRMKTWSDLAHEGEMDPSKIQAALDRQGKDILRMTKYVQGLLEPEEEKE